MDKNSLIFWIDRTLSKVESALERDLNRATLNILENIHEYLYSMGYEVKNNLIDLEWAEKALYIAREAYKRALVLAE